MRKKKLKVAVGMSGGVDSSVVAALLVEQGYEVTGVWLDCWEEPGCETDPDRKDAIKVGLRLGISFKVLDLKEEYKKRVMDWFYEEFKKGRTPNPDVVCNKEIKFGLFLDWVKENGFDYMATGHFARIDKGRLLRGVDKKKDQTYFLAGVSKEQLKKVMFPVGEMTKEEVRKEAKKKGLKVWDKKNSTGICLIGHEISFDEFLSRKIKEHKGEVVDMEGKVVGEHKGVEFYTIGQRHGFEVKKRTARQPKLYVVRKEMRRNRLVAGEKKDLERREFEVSELSWIGGKEPEKKEGWECKIRHPGRLIECKVKRIKNGGLKVGLVEPEWGLAAGQVCVFYQGEECLGGGVIKG